MNQHLDSLGWTLLHFCWQAGLLALLYAAVDRAAKNASSQARYLIALVALLSMLAAAAATFGYEELRNSTGRMSSASYTQSSEPSLSISGEPLAVLNTAANSSHEARQLEVAALLPWIDTVWLLGVACLSIRTFGGWWLLQRLRRMASVEAPEALRASFLRIARDLGINRRVELRLSHRITGPLTIGVFRSLVLLPISAVTTLSPEQLEVVLAHELAHIRRADYLWNLVQTTAETLFFFHPAVWWVSGKVREQRELCCDDSAMALRPDPVAYATALLRLEEQRRQELRLAMALDGHQSRSGLRARIARILGETAPDRSTRELASLPMAGACTVLLLLLLPMPQVSAALEPRLVYPPVPPSVSDQTPPVPASSSSTQAPVAKPAPATPAPKPSVPAAPASHTSPHVKRSPVPREPEQAEEPESPEPPEISTATEDAMDAVAEASEGATEASMAAGEAIAANEGSERPHSDYIDAMRAAGYDTNADTYIAMKIQGITPEYARAMAQAGDSKTSAADLIALKVQGVTPEYISSLHAAGVHPESIHDVIAYRLFKVDPEFIRGMQSAGFGSVPTKKLIGLRVQGVTPEYAKRVKQQFPDVTLDQLVQLRIFHIDDAFIASAKHHNFANLTVDKLVKLRLSGILNEDGGNGNEGGAR